MVDLEVELEQPKEDTIHITEQLGCLEKKLSTALQRVYDLRQRRETIEDWKEQLKMATLGRWDEQS